MKWKWKRTTIFGIFVLGIVLGNTIYFYPMKTKFNELCSKELYRSVSQKLPKPESIFISNGDGCNSICREHLAQRSFTIIEARVLDRFHPDVVRTFTTYAETMAEGPGLYRYRLEKDFAKNCREFCEWKRNYRTLLDFGDNCINVE